MNEINVSIPYSFFKMTFTSFFCASLVHTSSTSIFAINQAKKYWILMDSELRKEIIAQCEYIQGYSKAKNTLKGFLGWAKENIDAEHRKSLQRPLVDMLPVVNMAKVNHKESD